MYSPRVIWKSSSVLFLVALFSLFFGTDTRAEEQVSWNEYLGVSGSLRLAGWQKDKSFSSNKGYLLGSVWAQARPKEFLGIKTFFDGRVQGSNLTRSSYSSADLREGFAETSLGSLDLKVGRQILVWGRADKVNPTDSFSVKNFELLTTDDEDQRTGLFTTQVAWNQGNFRWIGLWQPEWRAPIYPVAPLPAGITLQNGKPKGAAEQFGLKLDYSGGEIDGAISYAQVIDRNPDLKVISSSGGTTQLEFNYRKIEVYGLDFAKSLGDYGLRGEAAYTRTKDSKGEDRLTKNSYIFSVLGVDRTFFGDLNLNVQYIYRHTFNWRSSDEVADANQRYLARQIEILANQKIRNFHAASTRVGYKMFHETLEAELALVGWFNNGLIRPKITYSFSDQWRGILGAEFYAGDNESFFGRLKQVSSVFLEARYLF